MGFPFFVWKKMREIPNNILRLEFINANWNKIYYVIYTCVKNSYSILLYYCII